MSKRPTLGNSILEMPLRNSELIALKYKRKDVWVEKNWPTYYADIELIACSLDSLGLKPGDRVAMMASTSPKWATTDLAILGSGLVTVPIYPNNTTEDVSYILNNSEARVLICEERIYLNTFKLIHDQCPLIEKVIVLGNHAKSEQVMNWMCFKALGTDNKDFKTEFSRRCEALTTEDVATILYTSGTTGRPKGVVLTHLQVISEASEAFSACGATPLDVALTFLPYAHILGRIEIWGHAYIGHTLAFAENLEKIRENLLEIRPTFLISVPRIFEKVHSAILTQVKNDPIKSKLFKWAVAVGTEVGEHRMRGQTLPLALITQHRLAKKLVLEKIKAAFGGRLRFAVCGGAPLSQEISKFFHAAELLILEGYGMTETTAAITVNTPESYAFGSVGKPIGEARVKVAEDGELLFKSDKVMKEYFKNPEATAEAFTDGWFHTGDIGEILPGGDIKITDRKKDLIKTSGGKYVPPQKLEGLLTLSPYIANTVIFGDQHKYIVALITLDKANVLSTAKINKQDSSNWEKFCNSSFVLELVQTAVDETNAQLASYESIKRFKILPIEFTVEGGELTPSQKVKRKVLTERYKDVLASLYEN